LEPGCAGRGFLTDKDKKEALVHVSQEKLAGSSSTAGTQPSFPQCLYYGIVLPHLKRVW